MPPASRALILLGAFALALATAPATAADPAVRIIPIDGKGSRIRLSPDGTTVATFRDSILQGELDISALPITLLDLASGEAIGSLGEFSDYTSDAAFTPDGRELVAIHLDGQVDRFDVAPGRGAPTASFQTTFLGYARVALLDGGATLFTQVSGQPTRFLLWDLASENPTGIMGSTFASYQEYTDAGMDGMGDVTVSAFAVSPDGTRLATATLNDEVALWRIPDGAPMRVKAPGETPMGVSIRQLAFSSDGSTLLWFDRTDSQTHRWDITDGAELPALSFGGPSFALSPDGSQQAWVESDGGTSTIRIAALEPGATPVDLAAVELQSIPIMTSVQFTPDGSGLVVGGFASPRGGDQIVVVDLG